MHLLRTNILANYAGQVWMALMGVAFVPLYIHMLGMEAFGLIGLMLSIQALSMLLDLGMGGALNRELARRSHNADAAVTIGDLVRTFEWL
ncbi:MAG TPA: polysaccharide biosynthesis protein, partial [Gammaproteobacteria bacterium]|nr:polysaccharide biosynthesis protein [Gammaproteobacteria bacterium]